MTRHLVVMLAFVMAAAGVLTACGSTASAGGRDALSLVSYSTPREVFPLQIDAFASSDAGRGAAFEQSYGSSGEQSRAVENGLSADIVAFSLAPDVQRLVDAGKVDDGWDAGPEHGMVTRSIVVFVVRADNPRKIEAWDDLLEDGIEVVTPNPFTSGGARWNLMAAFGAWTRAGDSKAEALDKLEQLLRNTPVQSKSAREALQVFAAGKGDVMLAYENEAMLAKEKGEDVEIVYPASTILIENPIAVTSASSNPKQAQAFVEFLRSPAGQRTFAEHYYRPIDEDVASEFTVEFPEPDDQFTIDDLGGWEQVMTEFFDRSDGAIAKIEQRLGASTDG